VLKTNGKEYLYEIANGSEDCHSSCSGINLRTVG